MKQHIVTIIQGDGSPWTRSLNDLGHRYGPEQYITQMIAASREFARGEKLVLPLTIHYAEVDG
jgi:hypothetical protein